MKRIAGVVGALLAAGLSVAAAVSLPGAGPTRPAELAPAVLGVADPGTSQEQDDGRHGGPIERFHRAVSCDLVDTSALPGNWTHGDYVTAVAGLGKAALVREAAHSPCGKPMVSMRGGPPGHAKKRSGDGPPGFSPASG